MKSEASIENKYYRYSKKVGILAPKYKTPQRRSAPDRINLLPKGRVFFIEFKAPGKTPTDKQLREHKKLRALGFVVLVIDQPGVAENWLDFALHDWETFLLLCLERDQL